MELNQIFLEYLRIQRSLKGVLNNYDLSELDLTRHFSPLYIKLLLYRNKGCQQFYKILLEDFDNHTLRNKWRTF